MAETARDEAERLVAAVLAMAGSAGAADRITVGLGALADTVSGFLGSLTATDHDTAGQKDEGTAAADASAGGVSGGNASSGGHQGGSWATGSAECCVCPICRVISTMRDPSPETAARMAIGAGELATGVAGIMRAFSSMMGERTTPKPPATRPRPENRDENWSAATRTTNRPGGGRSAATHTTPARAGKPPATSTTVQAGDTPAASAAVQARDTAAADSWAAATGASAARASAEHAAEVEARAARRAAEQAAQREAARAASLRAREAAERVAEAVRLAEAARDLDSGDAAGGGRPSGRTARKRDVWAAAIADAGVAAVGGEETLDHDGPGAEAAGDGARGDGAA